jgi:DNA-binding Xre family transcriptional regulator
MMKLYVKEVAQARGYKTARQLADAMSERFSVRFSYRTLYQYWEDEITRYEKDTLDRLCKFLEVPLSSILVHIPDERANLPEPGAAKTDAAPKARRSRTTSSEPKAKGKTQAASISAG